MLGGTGRTQLAAGIAATLWRRRAVDLLVWLTAGSRDAVVTGYVQALHDIGLPAPGEGPQPAASRFLAWLAETGRPWLVVLDDLASAAVMEGLWPRGGQGRVVVTAPRPDVAAQAERPVVVEVGTFSAREAVAHLSAVLSNDPGQRAGALDLATDLGLLPIALAQAGALMAATGTGCRRYRALLAQGRSGLAGVTAGDFPAIVAATCSLSARWAGQLPPAGLAHAALALAAMLDPNGIPGAVFTAPAARAFLGRVRGTPPAAEAEARAALGNLARAGLLTIDPASAARTVRVHALVQAAARRTLTAAQSAQAARAAADAVLEVWPQPGGAADVEQALRDCTAKLHRAAGGLLWAPACHQVLVRAGTSLDQAGLADAAIAYWRQLSDRSGEFPGAGHAVAMLARDRLVAACEAAGRTAEAITLYERSLTERQRLLGPAHPDTVATGAKLARAYQAAGRAGEAVSLAQRTLAECERALGPGHPGTATARASLAQALRAAGRTADAIPLYQRTLADRERVLGARHLDTIAARASLALALRQAGRLKDAIPVYQRTLADCEQVQGASHPDTITARANLADAYHLAGKLREAVALYERALADCERVQGADHPDTITARGNLASAYHSARRLALAIPLYERALADCERVQGAGHPDTLTLRGNLAHAYHAAGRHPEALAVFQRALADCERALGPGHPLTEAARENLRAATS
jgi:tetratricopeptide (TPR) repeat protein